MEGGSPKAQVPQEAVLFLSSIVRIKNATTFETELSESFFFNYGSIRFSGGEFTGGESSWWQGDGKPSQ